MVNSLCITCLSWDLSPSVPLLFITITLINITIIIIIIYFVSINLLFLSQSPSLVFFSFLIPLTMPSVEGRRSDQAAAWYLVPAWG